MRRWLTLILILVGFSFGAILEGQGSLSQQVLALLTRTNSWTGTNTFYDFRLPLVAIPSITTGRLYTDGAGVLYWNGSAVAGGGGGTTPHNWLSTTHPDTTPSGATRGAVVVGNATPLWTKIIPSVTGSVLLFDGADTVFSVDGSALEDLNAAELTGDLPAISGVNLIDLNADELTTGTVPLARLDGITNTQIDAAAAIAYSKLALAGSINLSSDTAATALPFAKGGTGLTAAADDTVVVSSGAAWVARTIPNCVDATHALAYTQATNLFSCQALTTGTGTVTSVDMSVPSVLTLGGNPITTSGTLALSLTSQTQNLFFAAPNGSNGTPTFRAVVNADLPLSGVSAGTYPSVTVNTRGIVTGATATVNLATVGAATILPRANGGTGIATSADDTTLVGSGAAWVQTALPNCTKLWSYSTTTNLFTCTDTFAAGVLVASAPTTITASWNNGAVNFTQLLMSVTNSASASLSKLVDLQVDAASTFAVTKSGAMFQVGVAFADLGTPTDGTATYCTNCAAASDPCTGASTGAMAFRRNGAWACF